MTKWLADFRVETNLVLLPDQLELTHVGDKNYEIKLRNAPESDRRPKESLALLVFLQADEIEDAETHALSIARDFLGILSFVTSHGFRIVRRRFVMDWTPGIAERRTIVYERDENIDQFPELTSHYIDTVREIERLPDLIALQRAIRWYSAGTRSTLMEDQFQYFWFVIELLADLHESKNKVRDECVYCGGGLFCAGCGKPAEHRPFPRQRIDALLTKANLSSEIRKDLFGIRNGLMHGESRDNIETEMRKRVVDFEFHQAVDKIGGTAFMALFNAMKIRHSQLPRVTFGSPSSYVAQTAVVRVHCMMGTTGDPNDPRIEDVVLPTITAEHIPLSDGSEFNDRRNDLGN